MGVCMTRCYTEFRRLSCWQGKSGLEDRDRLIDFDMFLDEQPASRPLSMVSLEKELNTSDVSLLHESESEDSDILFQLGAENEEMELQEEAAAEACQEALRIKKLAENSTELINPAKLALDSNALRKAEKDYLYKEADVSEKGACSNGKPLKEQASCSSPSSSVELEWENEDGLSPVTHIPGPDDISSDTASCLSQLSTPVSNGNEELEWDGHFTRDKDLKIM
ncbi:uncharacterized protein LOC118198381 isoform X2 [Stegodyphus dumicola]|uniref:uncharacterized protein LOC118198381 isoform X2 n=1 Tax=Stegodyphus dumicola TaxID=202533 RepID=UPI0015A89494|nr:uncharacterized protein LOC118198381 isoform X2 [Stegodyphus dumicola]